MEVIADARPFHREALLAFLRMLSARSAYDRFLTLAPPAETVDVELLLAGDARHRAVLALREGEVIGHAHAVASGNRDLVELGVVVADRWQGLGIGPRLVRALLARGPAAGARDLEFLVLGWNTRARRLIERQWPDAVSERDGDLVHYRVQA